MNQHQLRAIAYLRKGSGINGHLLDTAIDFRFDFSNVSANHKKTTLQRACAFKAFASTS